ncbi:MAG: recombinase family protein [Pseudomonadota bacterium]
MKIGYARVSTTGQSYETQEQKLKEAKCEKVLAEKQSGKSTIGRQALQTLIEFVREGDTVIVTKLDRLARSVSDAVKIVEALEAKGVHFAVLDNASIDTRTPHGKMVFHVLAAVGEMERSLINERTSEGRTKAMAQGIRFGRKESLSSLELQKLRDDAKTFTGSKAELGKRHGISRATVYRLLGESQNTLPA